MQFDWILILVGLISSLAAFSAIAGYISYSKRQSPWKGTLLGFLLGPIGVLIAWRAPFVRRPMVDEPALKSFRSMTSLQESRDVAARLPVTRG